MRRLLGLVLLCAVLAVTTAAPVSSPAAAGATSSAAAVYIGDTFSRLVGREPTENELERWTPTIEWGDREALSLALVRSPTWTRSRLDAWYRAAFGRDADPAGSAHWLAEVEAGRTIEEIASMLFGSDEHFAAAGGTVPSFVEGLYRDVLGREPDASGERYWADRIQAGTPRSVVAGGFLDAEEARRSLVVAIFEAVLERAPEPDALDHWAEVLGQVGEIPLAATLASSIELYRQATGEEPPPTPDRGTGTGFEPYAVAGDVVLAHPAMAVDLIGFHQSDQDGGLDQITVRGAAPSTVLPSRGRGTGRRTAADIVVPPGAEIRAPVTGTVVRAASYVLYCEHHDEVVVLEPDDHPGWRVRMLHLDGLQVAVGERVIAGRTVVATQARVLPFPSTVEEYTASPPWPHVHLDVIDPSVPDRPGSGC